MAGPFTPLLDRFEPLYEIDRLRIPEPEGVRMRLQRNEKPEAWPDDLQHAIYSSMPKDLLQQYPDPTLFYQKISALLGIPTENMVVTSGIDEPIRSLLLLTCNPGDKIVYTPGYAMYKVYSQMFGIEPLAIDYDPTRFVGPEEIIARTPKDAKILFIPNPSQPVENCFSLDQLREIATYCRDNDILFAIDEAYHFFGAPNAIPLTDEFDNVLVLRTFSKAFGAASLRLGYTVGNRKALKPLATFRLAHEANAYALHIGCQLVDHFDTHIRKSIQGVCDGRDFLRNTLNENGVPAWGDVGNFVLIDFASKERMSKIVETLKARGVFIRGGLPAPLESRALVTCGSLELMQAFYGELKDVMDQV